MLVYDKELNIKDIEDLLFGGETIAPGREAYERMERSFNFFKRIFKRKSHLRDQYGFWPHVPV